MEKDNNTSSIVKEMIEFRTQSLKEISSKYNVSVTTLLKIKRDESVSEKTLVYLKTCMENDN